MKVVVCLFCFLLCACTNRKNTGEMSEYDCSLDKMPEVVRCYKSSLYKDVNVLILDSLAPPLRGIVKMQECEKGLYVLDASNALFLFDNRGRYLRQIGGVGNGPGEYRAISDFVVNPVSQSIYVLEFTVQGIYVYDGVTGRFPHSIKLDDEEYRSRYLGYCDGSLFTDLYPKGEGNYLLRKVSWHRNEPDEYFLDRSVDNLGWPHVSGTSPFYQSGHGSFYFVPTFSRKIYEWRTDGIRPFFTVDSREWMDRRTVDRALEKGWKELIDANRFYNLSSLVVNDRFVLFNCQQGNQLKYVWGDITLGGMKRASLLVDDVLFAKEDDVCLPARYGTTDFNGDYYYMQPREIAGFWKQMKAEKLPVALKGKLNDVRMLQDMNPVILYYTYK